MSTQNANISPFEKLLKSTMTTLDTEYNVDDEDFEVCCCVQYNPSTFTGSRSEKKLRHDAMNTDFCRRISHLFIHMKGMCIFSGSPS